MKLATVYNLTDSLSDYSIQMLLTSFSTKLPILFYHCNKVHLATKSPKLYARLKRYSIDAIENENIVTYTTRIS